MCTCCRLHEQCHAQGNMNSQLQAQHKTLCLHGLTWHSISCLLACVSDRFLRYSNPSAIADTKTKVTCNYTLVWDSFDTQDNRQYQKSAVCHTPHYLPDFFLSRKECAVATTPPVASVTAGGNMNINKDTLQTGEEGCEHSLSYRYYYSWISIKCSTTAQRHVAVSMRIHPLQPLHRHICTYALFVQLTKPL